MTLADHLLGDIRLAVRSLMRAPLFTTVALVTLVLGIASVTTIVSFIYAYAFRPLPYPDAGRLIAVIERVPGQANLRSLSLPAARAIQTGTHSFERVAVYAPSAEVGALRGEPRVLETLLIDSSFAPLFGIRPALGRLLAPDEIAANAPVVMISHALWLTAFGGDSSIVGRPAQFGRERLTVVGVMPQGFQYPSQTDLWRPIALPDSSESVYVLGKLRRESTRQSGSAELSLLARQLARDDPRSFDRVTFAIDDIVDRRISPALPVLVPFVGATLFVLLIACSNVANLLLVRAAERRAEMAVRSALGAGRGRLLAHALVESALLAICAGVGGALVAAGVIRVLISMVDLAHFPSWITFGLDVRLLLFVVGIVAVVTIAVGLTPAREGMRFDLARALKVGGDGGVVNSSVANRARRGIAVQLALSVVLFVGASLLAQTYRHLSVVDVGYPADQVVNLRPYFDQQRYPNDTAQLRFSRGVLDRVRALPGARHTAITGWANPVRPEPARTATSATAKETRRRDDRLFPDGDTTRAGGTGHPIRPRPRLFAVSEDYFATLGLHVLVGRAITANDGPSSQPVVVVSRRLADLLWPGASPIGHTLQVGADGSRWSVVGVVDDVRDLQGGRAGVSSVARADAYLSVNQVPAFGISIVARGDPGAVTVLQTAVQGVARQIDPDMVTTAYTLARDIDVQLLVARLAGASIGALALCGLVLSVIGIYGVVAYGIAQRTREIGIRMALGSSDRAVVRLMLVRSLRFVGIGLAVGVVLSLVVGRVLRVLLFGVSTTDPLTYLSVCVLFGGVALLACYLPARRATRVDPVIALRAE